MPADSSSAACAGVGTASNQKNGTMSVVSTAPVTPLWISVVIGASWAAMWRVSICSSANNIAESNPSPTPSALSSPPGRTTTSMPAKPMPTPIQRVQRACAPGRSPSSHGDSATTNSGAQKLSAVACASGIRRSTLKNTSVEASISTPRSHWRRGREGRYCRRQRAGPSNRKMATTWPR
ncbi:hypothetical protein D3C87_1430370 [compost metagenome]